MYQKSILPNGIRVVSEVIPYVKSITLGVWVNTGSRMEEIHNHGISHFIEHMLFKGTNSRSAKDIADSIDAVGGQLNAFTAKEQTCYYVKVLDNHLELALDILSDMLLSSKFDSEDINREREVVLEEVNMYASAPDELVHDVHLKNVWSQHQLGENILGSVKSIEQFNKSLIEEYYRNFYTPDNIVIAAAGNLSHEMLVELTEKYFGKHTGFKRQQNITVPNFSASKVIENKQTEQVHLCIGSASVPQTSPDIYAIHLMNNIFGGGISSRLFQSIREEKGLAYSIYSYQSNYSDTGLFTVYAGTRQSNIRQVVELILQNMSQLKVNSITSAELTRAKEQLKGSLMLGLESSSSRMSRLAKMELTVGKYITLDEVITKIDNVTLADIEKVTAKLFDFNNLAFTALGPVSEEIYHEIKGF